ncbi:sensor histidine kinase, partial [Acinetobacter baumannii]|uniref:sensor histidine kinase n=1 Tax=Acinetobacter baumannii TaxID=470 RepID=UPI000B09A578
FIQILNNLLDNAVKHTAQGSITISAVESNGNIIISIIDTGEGIEQQDLDRIFEPFTSFDTAESQSFGLGLSI